MSGILWLYFELEEVNTFIYFTLMSKQPVRICISPVGAFLKICKHIVLVIYTLASLFFISLTNLTKYLAYPPASQQTVCKVWYCW